MVLPDFLKSDEMGFISIVGHRIGLHHVVRCYREGYSPEMLWEEFPTLSLAVIYKVIGFYLENIAEVDAYVAEHDVEMDRLIAANPGRITLVELRRRLEARRRAEAS